MFLRKATKSINAIVSYYNLNHGDVDHAIAQLGNKIRMGEIGAMTFFNKRRC